LSNSINNWVNNDSSIIANRIITDEDSLVDNWANVIRSAIFAILDLAELERKLTTTISIIIMATPNYEWTKSIDGKNYIISNKIDWHSHDFIQKAFDSKEVYWTHSIPPKSLELMLTNSCTLGLYESLSDSQAKDSRKQLGFARLITDFVTIAFLTDVYILPELQGQGLGKWMISCVREIIDAMPELRRSILLTDATGRGVKFYEQELDMRVFNSGDEGKVTMMYTPGYKKSE
jgi:GNAT superfamily N-acetyltransferase